MISYISQAVFHCKCSMLAEWVRFRLPLIQTSDSFKMLQAGTFEQMLLVKNSTELWRWNLLIHIHFLCWLIFIYNVPNKAVYRLTTIQSVCAHTQLFPILLIRIKRWNSELCTWKGPRDIFHIHRTFYSWLMLETLEAKAGCTNESTAS